MGKSKTRILRKGINNQITRISREEAVNNVVKYFNNNNLLEFFIYYKESTFKSQKVIDKLLF